jgi:Bax protein
MYNLIIKNLKLADTLKYKNQLIKCILLITPLILLSCSDKENTNSDSEDKSTESEKKSTKSQPSTTPVISVQEKKQRFKNLLAEPIVNEYKELYTLYKKIQVNILEGTEKALIASLKTKYRATTDDELLNALKPHPPSVALAQAALESAWATSRFFNEANNAFGVWSYDDSDLRIAAKVKRDGKTIWVKKYLSVEDSVKDYYLTLARGSAFKEFRDLKMTTSDPFEFVTKLDKYSEKNIAYTEELAAMIRYNKFDSYDIESCCESTD